MVLEEITATDSACELKTNKYCPYISAQCTKKKDTVHKEEVIEDSGTRFTDTAARTEQYKEK